MIVLRTCQLCIPILTLEERTLLKILLLSLILISHLLLSYLFFRVFGLLIEQKVIEILIILLSLEIILLVLRKNSILPVVIGIDILQQVIDLFQIDFFQIHYGLLGYILFVNSIIHEEFAVFIAFFFKDDITDMLMVLGENEHFFDIVFLIFK